MVVLKDDFREHSRRHASYHGGRRDYFDTDVAYSGVSV